MNDNEGCDGKHKQNTLTPAHSTCSHMNHASMCVDIRMPWISLGISRWNWLTFTSWPFNQFEIYAFLLTRLTEVAAGCSEVTVHCLLRVSVKVMLCGMASACRPAASKHKLTKP